MQYKRKAKKAAVFLLAASFLFSGNVNAESRTIMDLIYDGASHKYDAQEISLVINDKKLTNLTMPPIIFNNLTVVPAREVFEPLGAVVDWDDSTKEVLIGYKDILLIIKANNTEANVNGEIVKMSIPAKIINSKVMIPTRFVAENIGLDVNWDEKLRQIKINSNEDTATSPPASNNTNESKEPESLKQPEEADSLGQVPQESPENGSSEQTVKQPVSSNSGNVAVDVSADEIQEQINDETKITNVILPSESNNYSFSIVSSSPMSKVSKLLLPDNRLVLDIHNAEMSLKQTTFESPGSGVSKLRVGQNEMTPVKITRVVFELNAAVQFKVSLSEDRKHLNVEFEQNEITRVEFETDEINDALFLHFKNEPSVSVFTLIDPNRVVIDAPLTSINTQAIAGLKEGKFVSSVRLAQYDKTTVRIVLDVKKAVRYSVTTSGKVAKITLSEPLYRNIAYEQKVIKITKSNILPIDISKIVHTDLYNYKKYILTLPGDYTQLLGYGEIQIGDKNIGTINLKNNSSGHTEININENQILAYNIKEDSDYIYITPMLPKLKYDKIVVLDPGHGGHDGGTSHNGVLEKSVNLDIALRTEKLFEQHDKIKVYLTRTEDFYVERMDRAELANQIGDLFVSNHVNSADTVTAANGVETYYYPHSNDSTIGVSSQQVAAIMHKNMLRELQPNDRKVKTNSYVVLKYTEVPAVLLEVGFATNPTEAAKLATPEYRQKAAKAIYDGIVEVFDTYKIKR